MAVSYTAEVATCRHFGCFWKLLGRWRGSIYKVIWVDMSAFLACFYAMAIMYRYVLKPDDKKFFEDVVKYCNQYGKMVPLSFVLGFYISLVISRWWDQYITVPWPDPIAVYVSALVRGQDEQGRLMRRTIMRYVCLSLTMVLTMISPGIKRRFPTLDHIINAGLLNKNEANIIEAMGEKFPGQPKYWMPIMWATSIVTRARKDGRIWDDFSLKSMIDGLNDFRKGLNRLLLYDFINVPLVYTQVVTLAVYTYFLAAIFGDQWIPDKCCDNIVNFYFPLFGMLEFFFFVGWLKVAETLICPFGDDDDDFELNWAIDRNLQVSYLIVDEMHNDHPELVRDQYWDEVFPNELPYADESQRPEVPEATTAKMDFSKIMNATKSSHPTPSSQSIEENEKRNDPDPVRIRFAPQQFRFSASSISVSISESSILEQGQEEMGESMLDSDWDDFEQLREERNRERRERQMQKASMTLDLMRHEVTQLPSGFSSDEVGSQVQPDEEQTEQGTEIQTDESFLAERHQRPE